MTADLAGFLRARLDEDEQTARVATAGPWYAKPYEHDDDADCEASIGTDLQPAWAASDIVTGGYEGGGVCNLADAHHIARHDPARVLAEVDAKRRIIAEHQPAEYHPDDCRSCRRDDPGWEGSVPAEWPCQTLRLLALPYASDPSYKPEWAPDA